MTDEILLLISTEFKMDNTVSSANDKINTYKTFFNNPAFKRLIVCGEGGTGKTIALKKACEEVASHPPLEIIYKGEPNVTFPAKNSEAAVKTIVHCYTFDEEDYIDKTQIVVFTEPFRLNTSD